MNYQISVLVFLFLVANRVPIRGMLAWEEVKSMSLEKCSHQYRRNARWERELSVEVGKWLYLPVWNRGDVPYMTILVPHSN